MADEKLLCFSKYVVPIYIRENGVLKHEGTGFLVNSGENDYLVSAAHIFRQCEEKELLFLTGNKIACLIQFNAMMYNKKEEDDIYDIGVMAIIKHKPPYKSVDKESISIEKLLSSCNSKQAKLFGVIGFPATKSYSNNITKRVNVKLYRYSAYSISEEKYKKVGITSEHHIALHFDRKKCVNDDGVQSTFPKPDGLSGSPIVLIHDNAKSEQDQEAFIVGVATTYKAQEKLIYGASISIALQFMKEIDEEIRKAKA